jgi:hypothetical protein
MSWDEEDTWLPPDVGHSLLCLHPALHILLTRGSFGEGESHVDYREGFKNDMYI